MGGSTKPTFLLMGTANYSWTQLLMGKANAEGGEVNLPRPSKMAAFPLSKGGINIVFKNS